MDMLRFMHYLPQKEMRRKMDNTKKVSWLNKGSLESWHSCGHQLKNSLLFRFLIVQLIGSCDSWSFPSLPYSTGDI